MVHLLFPGRHHLVTNFQHQYLSALLGKDIADIKDVRGKPIGVHATIDDIIFPVTSANHSNTRRNPLPLYLRSMILGNFAQDLQVPTYVFPIDDRGHMEDFAGYILKEIHYSSDGLEITPDNTVVLCSTPEVLSQYEKKGFKVVPCELTDVEQKKFADTLPFEVVESIAKSNNWLQDQKINGKIHTSARKVWQDYKLGQKVQMLFSDAMLGDDGDLTDTRDYDTYVREMDDIADLKFSEVKGHIRQGRIGDIGCATGSWILYAAKDEQLRESDFIGVEASRKLYDICQRRKSEGTFGDANVFFRKKNAVTEHVFDRNSMNTIFTSSLTHEIESYGGRRSLLTFIKNRLEELAQGGVWINRDVVGPENADREVLLWLNSTDGRNEDFEKQIDDRHELKTYLDGMSTALRFRRFAQDFRHAEGYNMKYSLENKDGEVYARVTLRDAVEFRSKKDYTDNWQSEMHETFAFWDIKEWARQLENAGFKVKAESNAYANQWLVDNRYKGKVAIYEDVGGQLHEINDAATNMILIAEKK